jgi:pimeloyl-ACP methyl ester carboxylesterase
MLFLIILMTVALIHFWIHRSRADEQVVKAAGAKLSKQEKKLTFNLQYYMRLIGYDVEEYKITTKDGFVLVLHRLVDCTESSEQRSDRYPVLLIHGLMQSSAAYCTSGDSSLGLTLFRKGYDVWLGNNRCGFNPSHVVYSRMNPRMWQWGIKQMATMDVPCMIDFILDHTRASKVAITGHSQGTTQLFYALARDEMPELGSKVSSFCALSPAVYTGPLLDRWYMKFVRRLDVGWFRFFFGHHSFIGMMTVTHMLIPESWYTQMGYIMFNYLLGWDDRLWNANYRSRQFIFSPVYVSADLMFWWLGKGGFANQGCIFNQSALEWFDDKFPPLLLFVPGRDNLVNPFHLVNRLHNFEHLRELKVVDLPTYSHLDVLWAADADIKVGQPMGEFIWSCVEDKENWRAPKV